MICWLKLCSFFFNQSIFCLSLFLSLPVYVPFLFPIFALSTPAIVAIQTARYEFLPYSNQECELTFFFQLNYAFNLLSDG